jgi:hypothetical protein
MLLTALQRLVRLHHHIFKLHDAGDLNNILDRTGLTLSGNIAMSLAGESAQIPEMAAASDRASAIFSS